MSLRKLYIIIFFLALIPRLLIILLFPETGGDYDIYYTVAKNILNGCGVSLSNPNDSECIAHFGGNHGPGYPFFLSIIWYIFGENNFFVRLIQVTIFILCSLWLIRATYIFTNKKKVALWVGILLSISPLLIAWPRYIQTETLSLAFTILVLAELLLSLSQNKFRIIGLSLSLILATWIRLDNIFLSIPVAVTSIYIHGFMRGFLRGFLVALILSSTWFAWTMRNLVVELPSLIPTDMVIPDGSRPPVGYLKWTKTWVTHEYERGSSLWGINRKNYTNIYIPEKAYKDLAEKEQVLVLLKALKQYDQKEFPKRIDDKFKVIANEKIKNYPFQYWLINPLTRAIRFWSNPFSSFGWPNEMPHHTLTKEERLLAAKGNLDIILKKVEAYPLQALSKGFNAAYRGIIMLLFLISFYYTYKSKSYSFVYPFRLLSVAYIITRTLFVSFNANIETRYLLTTIPFIEVFIVVVFLHKSQKVSK